LKKLMEASHAAQMKQLEAKHERWGDKVSLFGFAKTISHYLYT
jgi:hypothetical protein